jgi:glutaredoxin
MRALALSILLFPLSVAAVQPTAPVAPAKVHHIVMYATKTCGYCALARRYFSQRGIEWKEIDIESSEKAAAQFAALGGVGTPLIFIDNKRIAGFDQKEIEKAL